MKGKTHRPHLPIPPLNDRMHAHKTGPATIGALKTTQPASVRIGPPGADEDGLDTVVMHQVVGKCLAHGGVRVAREREVVCGRGGRDEVVDRREGERRRDIDGGQGGRKGRVGVEEGEQKDEQEEAVFSAVVGEGEGRETGGVFGESAYRNRNHRPGRREITGIYRELPE